MIKLNNSNILIIFILNISFLFIIGYISYPFIISTAQINECNIKRFDKIHDRLEKIISECAQIYYEKYEDDTNTTMSHNDLPEYIRQMINKENLFLEHITMQQNGTELIIDARFENYRIWQLGWLPAPVLYYHSKDKKEIRPKNLPKGALIILGDGWSLYKY
jgi:hypothetical protein